MRFVARSDFYIHILVHLPSHLLATCKRDLHPAIACDLIIRISARNLGFHDLEGSRMYQKSPVKLHWLQFHLDLSFVSLHNTA